MLNSGIYFEKELYNPSVINKAKQVEHVTVDILTVKTSEKSRTGDAGEFDDSTNLWFSQFVYTKSDDIRHNLIQAAGLRVHAPAVTH